MSTPRRICFELVPSAVGDIEALRVPRSSLQLAPALVPDALAAMVSRLGLAECVRVDDASLIFCRNNVQVPIPRGIRLFIYA